MPHKNIKIIHVAAGIILKHNFFAATQIIDGKPFAGFWELPGGKLEDGEKPEEALKRELAEELGINVLDCHQLETVDYLYEQLDMRVILHFFLVNSFKGAVCPREYQNLRWVTLDEARKMDFLPADTQFINSLSLDKYLEKDLSLEK